MTATNPSDLAAAKNDLVKNGWALLPGIFSKEEIRQLRAGVLLSEQEKYGEKDLLCNPHLSHIVSNDRLLDIAASLLGSKPVYFGMSDFQINKTPVYPSLFHKDCADRLDQKAPDWTRPEPYSLIVVAVYLQDHFDHSGGVMVRDGSHHTTSVTKGKRQYVRSREGDVVIWYLTTSHAGNALQVRYPLLSHLPGFVLSRMHRLPSLFYPWHQQRIGLFITYGINDAHLNRYINFLKAKTWSVRSWQTSVYGAETIQMLEQKNMHLIQMREEAMKIDLAGTSDTYDIQLPY